MTWASHIHKVACKLSHDTGLISNLRYILPCYTLKILYDSLIQSHLNYGIMGVCNVEGLFKLQKRAVRAISCMKYDAHTVPILKALFILKLPDLFRLNLLKFYYDWNHINLTNNITGLLVLI